MIDQCTARSDNTVPSPRDKLLTAAKALFIRKGYNRVTIRAIADAADVNIALIKYYFVDKAGLFETVFRDVAAPLLELISQIKRNDQHEPLSPTILTQFIARYYQVMSQYPTLPKIIFMALHNTASKEHEIIKKIFFEHLESGVQALNNSLKELKTSDPIKTQWLMVSVIALSVFPFVMPNVLKPLLGVQDDQNTLKAIGEHQQAIFNGFLASLSDKGTV